MLKIIVRRWYAAVPILVAVLLIGPGLVGSADPEYRASGQVLVLRYDPTLASEPADEDDPARNPYGEFNASVVITAAVLEAVGNGDAFQRRVADGGGTADFTIEQNEDAPILVIEATAGAPAEAVDTVAVVAAELGVELMAQQQDFAIPAADQIVLDNMILPERATRLETARNRALTILIALGIAGVIAATVLTESFAQGRSRNRRDAGEGVAARFGEKITKALGEVRDPTPASSHRPHGAAVPAITVAPDEVKDPTPASTRLPPPHPESTFPASNGEPTTPSKPTPTRRTNSRTTPSKQRRR